MPEGGFPPQVPYVMPEATEHEPVQQSEFILHKSPACWQNDDAWHVPLTAQ
jgi:hypothetical protein